MKTLKLIALAMFFLVSATTTQAQKVDDILAKYFENTGGLENWKKLKSMKMIGKTAFGPQEFPFELEMKYPGMFRINVDVQGQKLIQACDGTVAWMINPFQGGTEPQKLPDDLAKEFLEQKFESEFVDYTKKGHEVTLEGKEEVDGVSCYKIKLIKNKNNDKEDVTEYHFFDAENYVPIMVTTFARSGPAKGMEAKQYFSDYQEVGGFILPFYMETKVNGQTQQKMMYEKYVLNQPVDDAIFAFPKK
jgi:outer membrane lipoprotein-sorting protein